MSTKYVPPHKRTSNQPRQQLQSQQSQQLRSQQPQQLRPQQPNNNYPNHNNYEKKVNKNTNYESNSTNNPSYTNGYNNNNNNSRNNNEHNRFKSIRTNRFSRSSNSTTPSTERNSELERKLFGDPNSTVSQGINFKNYDKIPVHVSGKDAPTPFHDFNKSNLCPILISNINLCKYTTPTPIQKYSIPCILQKRDLMACAQTGSGKTAAFLLPIIHNIYTNNQNRNNIHHNGRVYPSVVILSPTRELAIQIHVEATKFLYRTGLRACVVYGGTDWRKQASDLRYGHGVDLIVATPGRLNDFIQRGFIAMDAVEYNVLDEADNMLDMGFMPQIQQIIRQMPPKSQRQTLMFSATFPSEIQKLAGDFLDNYVFITVGRVGSTNACINQKLKYVLEYDKTKQLIEAIHGMRSGNDKPLTLIFVERKRDTQRVCKALLVAGYDAMCINGDKSQREREYALKMFKMGRISLLVATDVASRGINIANVLFVINYDLPNNIQAYVHRIGRTGRCGNNGNAISFVNERNKPIMKGLMALLKESKSDIPQWFADLCYKYGSSRNSYGSYNGGYNNKKKISRDFRDVRNGNGFKRNTFHDTNDDNEKQSSNIINSNNNINNNIINNNKFNSNITDSW